VKVDPATLRQIKAALASGRAVETGRAYPETLPVAPQPRSRRPKPAEMVIGGSILLRDTLTFIIPVATVSETNQRSWKGKAARAGSQRRTVSKHLGRQLRNLALLAEHYHAGGALDVVITRLGGRKLDVMANLEDAVCLMIGADDGDPRWRCRAEQQPGGLIGVRIELRAAG
jgi:hypothetical protein